MKLDTIQFPEFLHQFLDRLARNEEKAIDFLLDYFIEKNNLAGSSSTVVPEEEWARVIRLVWGGDISDHILGIVLLKGFQLPQEALRKKLKQVASEYITTDLLKKFDAVNRPVSGWVWTEQRLEEVEREIVDLEEEITQMADSKEKEDLKYSLRNLVEERIASNEQLQFACIPTYEEEMEELLASICYILGEYYAMSNVFNQEILDYFFEMHAEQFRVNRLKDTPFPRFLQQLFQRAMEVEEDKTEALEFFLDYFIFKNELVGKNSRQVTGEEWRKVTALVKSGTSDNRALALAIIKGFQLPHRELREQLKSTFELQLEMISDCFIRFERGLHRYCNIGQNFSRIEKRIMETEQKVTGVTHPNLTCYLSS